MDTLCQGQGGQVLRGQVGEYKKSRGQFPVAVKHRCILLFMVGAAVHAFRVRTNLTSLKCHVATNNGHEQFHQFNSIQCISREKKQKNFGINNGPDRVLCSPICHLLKSFFDNFTYFIEKHISCVRNNCLQFPSSL